MYLWRNAAEETAWGHYSQPSWNGPGETAGGEAEIAEQEVRGQDQAKSGGEQQCHQELTCLHGPNDWQLQAHPEAEE